MKSKSIFFLVLMSLLTFSCTDDITNMGSQIQPEGDKIIVDTATIYLTSSNVIIPFIYSRPDSLMLGTYVDYTYGNTYADVLTQVQPPLDFSYPVGAKADSAKVIMYYYSWFGDTYSPMEVNIYEMNKGKTFGYTSLYQSDIDYTQYCDKSLKLGSRKFTAKDAVVIRDDTTTLEFPLSSDFVKRFSPVLTRRYSSDKKDLVNYSDRFQDFFNGMYITTDFGSASMLYVRGFVLRYYFHYKYLAEGATDSTTVSSYVNYPANKEVRQINRFQHPDINTVIQNFNAKPEVNVISSPSNIYTQINVPLSSIKTRLNVGSKKLLINRSYLRINATELNDSTLAQPLSSALLLVKKSEFEDFFKYKELPSDTTAILASYAYEYDDNDELQYYYTFDIAKLISNELSRSIIENNIEFMLVPVTIQYDGNGGITQVKHKNLMSAFKICSGANKTKPMKIDMVYSGF